MPQWDIMIFPFKVIIDIELCKYKNSIKDKLHCYERSEIYKMAFLWNFVFIWFLGSFELTAENHQGRNYYARRHILTVGFLKKRQEKTLLKGINVVNPFEYLIWFLMPFIFAIIDVDLSRAILISLVVMIISMLLGFNKDKHASKLLVKKLNDNNE